VEVAAIPFQFAGKPAMLTIFNDITERNRAAETLRQRLAELEAVNRISAALRSAQTLGEMLPILLDVTLEALRASQGCIWLYDPAKDELRPAVSRGWGEEGGVLPQAPVKPGEGITGYVFSSGQPYTAAELCVSPHVSPAARQWIPPGIGGATIPIRTGQTVIGAFAVNVHLPRELSPDELHLLSTLSEIAGNAIQRISLHQQTVRQLDLLEALHGIDKAISGSMSLTLTLDILLDHVKTQLQVDAAGVLLIDPYTQTLGYAAGHGFRTRGIQTSRIRMGDSLAGRAALERHTVQVDDLAQVQGSPRYSALWAGEGFVAYRGVPLIAKGKVKGVLEIYHRAPFHHEADWISFLETLAGQAAIAIDSAQLFQDLQHSSDNLSLAYDATIEGWSRALDLRDKETEGHTERVAAMAVELAHTLGLTPEELVHVRRGALLHDIGKMGVPDGILLKPGPLTEDEWKVMRAHPRLAHDMLSPIGYLRPALDIPYCHHEKWDGSGYPRGLKGEQIPFSARIFAIVDVWDALRSNRPYRPAWPEEKVHEQILALSGTHMDPNVVQAFLRLLQENLSAA
jgi:putative nucleotidyltransferase with HDIG domain